MTGETERPAGPPNGAEAAAAFATDEKVWHEALSAYGQVVDDQLEEERRRKASLEQRGTFVITTAGTLVSLLFGLAAVATSRGSFVVPAEARVLLTAAVCLFALAALGGLAANVPLRYPNADPQDLRRLITGEFWTDGVWVRPPFAAMRRTSELRVDLIQGCRRMNRIKAYAVVSALVAEVMAVGALSAAIGVIL
jgi:hypothetical protein